VGPRHRGRCSGPQNPGEVDNYLLAFLRDTGDDYHYDPAMWNRHRDNLTDDPQLGEAARMTLEEQSELFLHEIVDTVNGISAQEMRPSCCHARRWLGC